VTFITGNICARPADAPARFVREHYFDKGWNLCLEQFLELFPKRYGYIYRPLEGGSWISAKENWQLTDTEILKAISCAPRRFLIGARSDKKTRYAVLDIDKNSKYHTKLQLDKLLKVLSDAGLKRSSLYRSSESGGWHLYIFFEEWLNSLELRKNLTRLLSVNGFEIAKGKLEVFPHPGNASLGMGLRLPLQEGFAWLDKQTLEVEYEREFLSPGKALELFIDVLESDANSFADYRRMKSYIEELESRHEVAASIGAEERTNVVPIRRLEKLTDQSEYAVHVGRIFGGLPPNINAEDWSKGRLFHIQGLDGPSQRADSLFCLGHYLFYGDPSRDLPALGYGYEQEREWAIKEFLEARHNGHSVDISRGQADALAQVERAAHWLPLERRGADTKKYVAQQPVQWVRANAKKLTESRKKIQRALDDLKKLGRSFTTVELEEQAGVSRRTLYKHDDIWRRDYEDLAAGFFASCLHKYNAVEEAASPQSKPPSSLQEKMVPPGLLAARRIVYELSMRSKRHIQRGLEAAARSSEAASEAWREKVAFLSKDSPPDIPSRNLRPLIVILSDLLGLAPYEEDAAALLPYLRQLRRELAIRAHELDRKEGNSS
jgi:hypothetical protein